MDRPLKKNIYTRGINNLVKFSLLFSVFFTSVLLTAPEAKAAPCNAPREDADIACSCKINECRISIFDERGWFDGADKPGTTQYECIPAGSSNSRVDVNAAPYSNYTFQYYYDKLGLKAEGNDNYPRAVMDIFSNNVNKQMIPQGSVCKSVNGQAFWYYEDYFKNIMKGGTEAASGAYCDKPILVTRDLFGNNVSGVGTFFGCLPASVNGAVAFVLRLGLGIGTFVTVLIVLINLIKIISSSTNPDAVTEARKKMTSGIFSLIALYLALTILSIAGLQILDLGSAGGSLLRLFTGG